MYACNGYLLQGFTSTNRDGMCEVLSSDLIEPILSLLSLHLFAQLPPIDVIPFSPIFSPINLNLTSSIILEMILSSELKELLKILKFLSFQIW